MRLETELSPGVVLVDVGKEMPRQTRNEYPDEVLIHRRRQLSAIERVYVHHSGAEGKPGLLGAENSARYVVNHRGFHCAAYHYWIPSEPIVWRRLEAELQSAPGATELVVRPDAVPFAVLRLNADSERTWHTGGKANTHGIGVCLQGNLNKRDLTDFQKECMEALLPWLCEYYDMCEYDYREPSKTWLSWHSASRPYVGARWLKKHGDVKKACPGKYTEQWLREYLA